MRTIITIGYRTFSLPAKDGLVLLDLLEKARHEESGYISGSGYLYFPAEEPLAFSAEVVPDARFVTAEEVSALREAAKAKEEAESGVD